MVEQVKVPAEDGLNSNEPPKAGQVPTVDETLGRPAWLEDKYKTVEDFLKSHKELQADHTRKSQALAEIKKTAPTKDDAGLPSDDTDDADKDANAAEAGKADKDAKPGTAEENAKKAAEGETILPGVTNEFVEEISKTAWETGEITEEHYAKLAEAGYSKTVVDQYMSGQMQAAKGATDALVNAGGGQENVQAMFDWAQESMTPAEVKVYNDKFAVGGADALMAMENLKTKFDNSGVGPGGKLVGGGNAPGVATTTYQSVQQVQADMSDPRYKVDPAFRDAVAQKIARSNVL